MGAALLRSALNILGWCLTTIGLYAGLVALDLYWNLPAWEPRGDSIGWFLVAWLAAMLAAFWFLSRAAVNRLARVFALVICMALVALAIYIVPEEPTHQGLFARPCASPLWYRGGAAVILILPALFWVRQSLRLRKPGSGREAAPSRDPQGSASGTAS